MPVVSSDKKTGSGHILKYRKFPLKIWKHFVVLGGQTLTRAARELVECPSLENMKVIWTWSWTTDSGWPSLRWGIRHAELERALPQPQPFCDSVI